MGLKEFHIITFTNREAYERAIRKVDGKYGKKFVSGKLYKILRYLSTAEARTRDEYTYEGLLNLTEKQYLTVQVLRFRGWTQFEVARKTLGDYDDVFGKITVELK